MGEFMKRMNFKAAQLGMSDSIFVNPYGGKAFGYNQTTCMDILKLGIHAYGNAYIMDVLSTKGIADVHIYGEHERDVAIKWDLQADFDYAYNMIHPGKANPHIVYAGKGGGWSTGENRVFAYMAYCKVCGRNVLAVVANVSVGRTPGMQYRKNAIIELLDICSKAINGGSTDGLSVSYADYAAAALLPENTPSVFFKNRDIMPIFSQGADVKFNPASMTKVLMGMTAMDICANNFEMYKITDEDICNDSDYWAFPGDIESIGSGMYVVLLSSNGSNTLAMARFCGEKILAEKRKYGISL